MLPRTLEPELMDTAEDVREYDTMDHAAVNERFVGDLLAALQKADGLHERAVVLDLGAGTGLIPIELCRSAPELQVVAVDAAQHMLASARKNVEAARLTERIELIHGDAKQLAFPPATFAAVVSNSILHHIADPRQVIAEAVRVAAPGGLLFHRDLCRPDDESQVKHLVSTYAADATPYQQRLLADSLRAALTLDEARKLVAEFGFPTESVQMKSDRHWTWSASSR